MTKEKIDKPKIEEKKRSYKYVAVKRLIVDGVVYEAGKEIPAKLAKVINKKWIKKKLND